MDRIDRYLGVHGQALPMQQERMSLLASNIANAATPGYKARDLDFQHLLSSGPGAPNAPADISAGARLKATSAAHFSTAAHAQNERVAYRVPVEPSLDGNTVELATEQLQFAETALRYRSTLSILSGRLSTLTSALKGE